MALPDDFIKRGLKEAAGSSVYGVRFEDMSRDELVACAATGWKAEQAAREEGGRRVNSLMSLF